MVVAMMMTMMMALAVRATIIAIVPSVVALFTLFVSSTPLEEDMGKTNQSCFFQLFRLEAQFFQDKTQRDLRLHKVCKNHIFSLKCSMRGHFGHSFGERQSKLFGLAALDLRKHQERKTVLFGRKASLELLHSLGDNLGFRFDTAPLRPIVIIVVVVFFFFLLLLLFL
jgi:ABC-type multidrug transport system fused ATPase/permease subunit